MSITNAYGFFDGTPCPSSSTKRTTGLIGSSKKGSPGSTASVVYEVRRYVGCTDHAIATTRDCTLIGHETAQPSYTPLEVTPGVQKASRWYLPSNPSSRPHTPKVSSGNEATPSSPLGALTAWIRCFGSGETSEP